MTALAAIGKWCLEYWYVLVIAAALLALGGWGLKMKSERDAARVEYADYRKTIAEGAVKAAEAALKKTIADQRKRDEADAENLRLQRDLAAATRRLRDARATGSLVPAAASCPERPASACFNRDALERALRDFDAGIQGLVDEGGRAVIDLDTARRWAEGLQ